jgi:hypothetical protein
MPIMNGYEAIKNKRVEDVIIITQVHSYLQTKLKKQLKWVVTDIFQNPLIKVN